MALFQYTAKDQNGNAVSGQLDAGSESAVADMLRRRTMIPLTIVRQAEAAQTDAHPLQWWQPKVSLTDLIMLSRQMYSLMRAGIPIIRAIEGLAQSAASKRLQQVLQELVEQLENGRS